MCWPAAPSGHVLSAFTTCCSEIYVWTSGESIQLCGRNERSFLLFPFSFFFLPAAFCPPRKAKCVGELSRIHAEKNSKKYQPALNSYFSRKGGVGAFRSWALLWKKSEGNQNEIWEGKEGQQGKGGSLGPSVGDEWGKLCWRITFVLPIWWGCNYRRIELTRHGGPFFRLRSHLSSVIIFEKKVNLEMGKWPRNSDHQLSGCGVPATELSLSITPCFMVRRSDFPMIVLPQDLGCITEMKDSTLNCLSPCGPHLDSTVFQNTDRQHGSYLWSKCAACSRVWLAKTSLSPWRGQHSKDGAGPWAVGHQCDLDQQRNAPWNRKDFI